MAENNYTGKINTYIKEMPSLPVSVGKVLEICSNMTVNPSDLNNVISLDPVLTGRLLKLINSAYYGLSSHVRSLVKATTMLGINTVKNLALSTAILSTLPKNKMLSGLNMEGYWRHCLCVAVTAKFLAVKQGVDPSYHQEYFTAGLLHDIGKIPLNAVLSADYMHAVAKADREHKQLLAVEDNSLGINHCAAGEIIAKAWKLDSPLVDVISWHNNMFGYSGKNMQILCTVAAANYFSIVYDVGFAGNRNPLKLDENNWRIIGLNENSFEEFKDKVSLEIEKARIFLKIS